MITRGYVLVSYPLDRVKDTVLETCKEMNAEVRALLPLHDLSELNIKKERKKY